MVRRSHPRRFAGGLPWAHGLPPSQQPAKVQTAAYLVTEAVQQLDALVVRLDQVQRPDLADGVLDIAGRLRQALRLVDPLASEPPWPERRGPLL